MGARVGRGMVGERWSGRGRNGGDRSWPLVILARATEWWKERGEIRTLVCSIVVLSLSGVLHGEHTGTWFFL